SSRRPALPLVTARRRDAGCRRPRPPAPVSLRRRTSAGALRAPLPPSGCLTTTCESTFRRNEGVGVRCIRLDDHGVRVVTLQDPARRNAMGRPMAADVGIVAGGAGVGCALPSLTVTADRAPRRGSPPPPPAPRGARQGRPWRGRVVRTAGTARPRRR